MGVTYTQTGGARLDQFNASWPLARLCASQDGLRLSCLGRNHDIPRSRIRRLSRVRGLVSVGLRIEHCDPSAPGWIVFWASSLFWMAGFRRLKEHLERLGYAIES